MNRFLTEEDAQATAEYVLILAVLVTLAILVVRDLIRPALERLTESITKAVNERLFKQGESMHRSPFKGP